MSDLEDDVPVLIEAEPSVVAPSLSSGTVPLTIICGFLGAGKSTLIRRILTERHGYRIAVIMNEFGDTADIEAKAINISSSEDPLAENSEEFLELANGCLCCSIKDLGIAAVEKLMRRKGAFDHILLETTGLADPGPIASMFWHNEEFAMGLGRDIHLDGVLCVVDAVFGQKQMEEDNEIEGLGESLRQIAGADVILLNKIDLVSSDEVGHLQHLISQVNPAATIYKTVKGEIDLGLIMGIDAYSTERTSTRTNLPKSLSGGELECDESCKEGNHTHHLGPHHYELRGVSSLQVAVPPLTSDRFQDLDVWIRTLLWENRLPDQIEKEKSAGGIEVLRCKGIFTKDTGDMFVLQGVRNMYEISKVDGDEASVGLPDEGKLVLIGKGLNQKVRESLQSLLLQ